MKHIFLLALLALFAAFLMLAIAPSPMCNVGSGTDLICARGFETREFAYGEHFRWSNETAEIHLANAGYGYNRPFIAQVRLRSGRPAGFAPVPARFALNGQTLFDTQVPVVNRHYRFVVSPHLLTGDIARLQIASATWKPNTLSRTFGLIVVSAGISPAAAVRVTGVLLVLSWMGLLLAGRMLVEQSCRFFCRGVARYAPTLLPLLLVPLAAYVPILPWMPCLAVLVGIIALAWKKWGILPIPLWLLVLAVSGTLPYLLLIGGSVMEWAKLPLLLTSGGLALAGAFAFENFAKTQPDQQRRLLIMLVVLAAVLRLVWMFYRLLSGHTQLDADVELFYAYGMALREQGLPEVEYPSGALLPWAAMSWLSGNSREMFALLLMLLNSLCDMVIVATLGYLGQHTARATHVSKRFNAEEKNHGDTETRRAGQEKTEQPIRAAHVRTLLGNGNSGACSTVASCRGVACYAPRAAKPHGRDVACNVSTSSIHCILPGCNTFPTESVSKRFNAEEKNHGDTETRRAGQERTERRTEDSDTSSASTLQRSNALSDSSAPTLQRSNALSAPTLQSLQRFSRFNASTLMIPAAFYAFSPLLEPFVAGKYDPLPAALAVGALALFATNRVSLAGIALGLGATIKWTPLLAVPFLVLHLLREQRWQKVARFVLGFFAAVALCSLPFALRDMETFLHPYLVQGGRGMTGESIWLLVGMLHDPTLYDAVEAPWGMLRREGLPIWLMSGVQLVILALTGLIALVCRVTLWRTLTLAALAPALFFILNRIFSPQYMLPISAGLLASLTLLSPGRIAMRVLVAILMLAQIGNLLVWPLFLSSGWIVASAVMFVALGTVSLFVIFSNLQAQVNQTG